MYMLDLIIIVLAFFAGLLLSYLIFRQKLQAIERAAVASGLGVALALLAIFLSGGFSGVKELRYNLWLTAGLAIIVSGIQICICRAQVGER